MLLLMGSVISAAALSSCGDFLDDSCAYGSTSFHSSRSGYYSGSHRPSASYVSTPSSGPNCDPTGDPAQRTHHWGGHHGSPAAGETTGHPHHGSEQPGSSGWGLFGHRGNDNASSAQGVAHQHHHHQQPANQASASSDSAPNPPAERERRHEEPPAERQPDPAPAASAPAPSEPAPAPAEPKAEPEPGK
ncbi:MAG: hypothetical protein JWR15_2474 [Prosthecobacter sp.]|nr:hypothetical protein [Prosthecobacter sp.]